MTRRTAAELACIARDRETCRRCGRNLQGIPASVHHRLPRSGGTKAQVDQVANLVLLCGHGTSPGMCHSHVHAHPPESYAQGWLIRRGSIDGPFEIPIQDTQGRLWFLTEEGDIVPTTLGGLWPEHPELIERPW